MVLAYTPGEPAGIGPDLIIQRAAATRCDNLVVISDVDMIRQRAEILGLPLAIVEYPALPVAAGALSVMHESLAHPVQPGVLDPRNSPAVVAMLERACDGALNGLFAGMVTGPVQKSVIMDAGIEFSGHTEFLQHRAAVEDVVMLLVADTLRVALATTHLPLADVSAAITPELLQRRLCILARDLQNRFSIPQPTILVAGLNPHAGEGGHLGLEDEQVIAPVLNTLRQKGMDVRGPLPADTLFTPRHLRDSDAVFAMYHDQGLPVLKYAGFGQAVNITLGLPFVRTSVDHGTALDLAGTGTADTGSLFKAIEVAEQLSQGTHAPA